MQRDELDVYAPPGELAGPDSEVAAMARAVRAETRRQVLRLMSLGVGLGGGGAFLLWRVVAHGLWSGRGSAKAGGIAAGLMATGALLIVIALVMALRRPITGPPPPEA